MKNPNILRFWLLLAISCALSSCKYDNEELGLVEVEGKVVLINSNTPVANALVRFINSDDNLNPFTPEQYTEVGSDTTDENGNFVLPEGLDADYAQAFGLDSIYLDPSVFFPIRDARYNGKPMKLELIPPAWLRISVSDDVPTSSDIIAVRVFPSSISPTYLDVFEFFDLESGDEAKILSYGNIEMEFYYRYIYSDLTFSETFVSETFQNPPFDTTKYVINY